MPQSASDRKRIALVIHALHGGGAERLMSQLAARWSHNHDVHLITWSKIETDKYTVPNYVTRHGLDLMRPSSNAIQGIFANFKRVRELKRCLSKISPDFVLSFSDQTNIVTLQATSNLSRARRIPVWISEHSDPAKQRLSRLWEAWRNRVYPRATGCVVLTKEIASYFERWVPASKIRVIPPALTPLQDPPRAWTDRSKRILFVGRLSREKRVELLVEAWKIAANDLSDWNLEIVGDGEERAQLERLAQSCNRIKFHGWISNREQIDALYSDSKIFVLTSIYEGFPVALIEALNQGLAAVSTDCSTALLPLNEPHKVVRIAQNDAPQGVADEIVAAANSSKKENWQPEQAVQAASRFHWPQIGMLWDKILESKSDKGLSQTP